MILHEYYILSNGVKIPKVGFGTWQIKDGPEAYQSSLWALKHGYLHIDTAAAYGNEESIARAIKDSKIPREKLFITTKLQAHLKGYDVALKEFEQSLKKLGLDYLDLYLIHAPWPWNEIGKDCTQGNIDSWKAFIKLYEDKKIRSIGVSNFSVQDIEKLVEATGVYPMVNQIPFWIGKPQTEIRDYCKKHNILVEAYSPLQTGKIFSLEIVHQLASAYKVTPAQIAIRYTLEQGTLPLPKSTHENRIIENAKLDFKLSKEDLAMLEKLSNV